MKITGGIKHGKLDQNGGGITERSAQVGVQLLNLAQRAKGQKGLLSLLDGDGSTVLLLDDKSAVGLDGLGATSTAVNQSTLTLDKSLLSLLIRGELDESKRHVVGVAADLDPALAVLEELTVESSLERNIILWLRQAG